MISLRMAYQNQQGGPWFRPGRSRTSGGTEKRRIEETCMVVLPDPTLVYHLRHGLLITGEDRLLAGIPILASTRTGIITT